MRVTIYPGKKTAAGKVTAPPSKSMAHRELICAGLSDGESIIYNVAESEDILATMDCLRALGAGIQYDPEDKTVKVRGTDPYTASSDLMHCRESGSTLRFMLPVLALSSEMVTLTGSGRLMQRPLSVYEDIFSKQNIPMERSGNSVTAGGTLKGGEFTIPGNISSQFISGLLFALPLCIEDSIIKLQGDIESRPYIDMTIKALSGHDVRAWWDGDAKIIIPGRQRYRAAEIVVEGDWSNAAYLMATGACVTGLDPSSIQGDKVCCEYFRQLDEGNAVIDIKDCPDLGPVLMAYAAAHSGATLTGTERLKYKESDRGRAMQEELSAFGVSSDISGDSICVGCGLKMPDRVLSGHNDHRIVMALASLLIITGGTIDGAEAVNKSFPDFFDRLRELGLNIEEEK